MTPVKRTWSETRSPMLQTGNMVVRFFGVFGGGNMHPKRVNARQRFLEKIHTEDRAAKIRRSKAWLCTQQILKRSGRSCVRQFSLTMTIEDENHFDFMMVRHLYMLQLASAATKYAPNFPRWTEVGTLRRQALSQPQWFSLHIIVPRSIRRKADAFYQITGKGAVTEKPLHASNNTPKSDAITGFKGSLYAALCRAYGERESVDRIISDFPVSSLEMKIAREFDVTAYHDIHHGNSPTLLLFCLECNRLGYKTEYEHVVKLMRILSNVHEQEQLGNALFFSLLYQGEEDIFTLFFEKLTVENRQSETRRFISHVYNKYLFSANKRRYQKKQLDSVPSNPDVQRE